MLQASDDPFAYFGMLDDEQRQELLRRYPDRKGYDDLRYPENYPAPNTTGGLGGLGSIFDIIKNRMPAPPVSDGGPMKRYPFPMPPGKGQGPRSMQFIDENRNGIDDRDEENVIPLPPLFPMPPGKGQGPMPTGPISDNRMPRPMPSRPQMPDPDMLQKLEEALRQKQNLEMPQRPPPLMRGDMRKKGLLGGLIQKLEMQAAQKSEQPQMPTRPRTRGGMFRRAETLQNTQPYRGGRFGLDKFRDLNNRSTGGSGGILPRASGEPDLEQIRKQIMRGINVRGIGM